MSKSYILLPFFPGFAAAAATAAGTSAAAGVAATLSPFAALPAFLDWNEI